MQPVFQLALFAFIAVLLFALTVMPVLVPWWKGRSAGLSISPMDVLMMRMRRIDPAVIVAARIATMRAGMDIALENFEMLYLARGHVAAVTRALIAAKDAKVALDFDRACAIDLAGRDVEAAVQGAIHAHEVAMPAVKGVSSDGYVLMVAATLRLRTCLERLVGGATEATVLARLGQAIVEEVEVCADHRLIDADRAGLVERIIARDITRNCAFTIDTITITTVTVVGPVGSTSI